MVTHGMGDRLSAEEVERTTRELLENDDELKYDPALHPQIVDGVRRRSEQLSILLGEEIAALGEARRAWHRPWTIAAMTLFVASLLMLGWTTYRSTGIPFRSREADTAFSLGLVALGTLTVVERWNTTRRRIRVASRELRAALMPPLRALVRLIISELQSDEVHWSGTLRTAEAPALVELDLQDTIPSRTYERLRTFIAGHESSATGLAGARGSGKTTLMRRLRLDESLDCHVALVSAPVHYSAVEFIRLIHRELAQVALKPGEAGLVRHRMAAPARPAVPPIPRTLLALVVALAMVISWIYDRGHPASKPFDLGWTGLTAVVVGALVVGFVFSRAWAHLQARTRLMDSPQTARELCLRQLDFLRWSTTLETSTNTTLKVSGSGFGGGRKLSRTEREFTHAESVQALREFVDQLLALTRKPVVICVDELDKLADPADAVDAINGLKDLFHAAKGHFVLSVSTDAMHSFAARGVPVRDVFDSAFDTIISVSPLSLEESQTLISRRARDFSKVFVLFCHAWSGGHARDLIRTARSCVDLRRECEDDEEATIARLSRRVLRNDLREVVDATVEKLRGENDDRTMALLDRILTFQEALEQEAADLKQGGAGLEQRSADLGQGAADLYDLVEASELPDDTATVAAEAQPTGALASYARIAGLCERLFSVTREPAAWRTEAMTRAVTALAEARSSLGRHPREIERKTARAARACAAVEASS